MDQFSRAARKREGCNKGATGDRGLFLGGEDRRAEMVTWLREQSNFDRLPESVAVLTLSKLRHAQSMALCSCVSRRWRYLVQQVDTLTFESFHLFAKRMDHPRLQIYGDEGGGRFMGEGGSMNIGEKGDVVPPRAAELEAIVSQMLLKTSAVRRLSVAYHPVVWPWIADDHFTESTVCTWLRHTSPSLEQLSLVDPNRYDPQPQRLESLSRCARLRSLNLCYGNIPEVPASCTKFESLQGLSLDVISIADEALEAIVALCPLLHSLLINSCAGLVTPSLSSATLHGLTISNEVDPAFGTPLQRLSLHTPRLQRLSLVQVIALSMEEVPALEDLDLLSHVRCSVTAPEGLLRLTSLRTSGFEYSLSSIAGLVALAPALQILEMAARLRTLEPLSSEALLHNLLQLQRLDLGPDVFACLQLQARRSSNTRTQTFTLPLLEDASLMVHRGDCGCIDTLRALLLASPRLRALDIDASQLGKGAGNVSFFSDVLALQREFANVCIKLSCPCILA